MTDSTSSSSPKAAASSVFVVPHFPCPYTLDSCQQTKTEVETALQQWFLTDVLPLLSKLTTPKTALLELYKNQQSLLHRKAFSEIGLLETERKSRLEAFLHSSFTELSKDRFMTLRQLIVTETTRVEKVVMELHNAMEILMKQSSTSLEFHPEVATTADLPPVFTAPKEPSTMVAHELWNISYLPELRLFLQRFSAMERFVDAFLSYRMHSLDMIRLLLARSIASDTNVRVILQRELVTYLESRYKAVSATPFNSDPYESACALTQLQIRLHEAQLQLSEWEAAQRTSSEPPTFQAVLDQVALLQRELKVLLDTKIGVLVGKTGLSPHTDALGGFLEIEHQWLELLNTRTTTTSCSPIPEAVITTTTATAPLISSAASSTTTISSSSTTTTTTTHHKRAPSCSTSSTTSISDTSVPPSKRSRTTTTTPPAIELHPNDVFRWCVSATETVYGVITCGMLRAREAIYNYHRLHDEQFTNGCILHAERREAMSPLPESALEGNVQVLGTAAYLQTDPDNAEYQLWELDVVETSK